MWSQQLPPAIPPAEPVLPNPRGSEEDLAEAIEILTGDKTIDQDKQQKLYDELKNIAQWLLSDLDSEDRGVRVKDVQAGLSELQKQAVKFRSVMHNLHPEVANSVQSAIK